MTATPSTAAHRRHRVSAIPGSGRTASSSRPRGLLGGHGHGRRRLRDPPTGSSRATQVRLAWARPSRRSASTDSGEHLLLYDHVLDTAVMVGAVPDRFRGATGGDRRAARRDLYFAMARGDDQDVPPLEMTKWFDTNYHYLVPETRPATPSSPPTPRKPVAELREARALGLDRPPGAARARARSCCWPSPPPDALPDFEPLDLLDGCCRVYAELLAELARAGADWVQLDEPALVQDRTADRAATLPPAPTASWRAAHRPAAAAGRLLLRLARRGASGSGRSTGRGPRPGPRAAAANLDELAAVGGLPGKTLVAGVVDGRNVWLNDLERHPGHSAAPCSAVADRVVVSTSCSLLHVPLDVRPRARHRPAARAAGWPSPDQKLAEVVALAADRLGTDAADHAARPRRRASATPRPRTRRSRPCATRVRARRTRSATADRRREPYAERAAAQRARLALPPLPTTTIGSFPQTDELRAAHGPRSAPAASTTQDYVRRAHADRDPRGDRAAGEASASTSWCTASPNATTWSSTSPSSSTAISPPSTAGCSPTAPATSARRSCTATSPAPSR